MCPKDAHGMVNSIDPDHSAPSGKVGSGSTLICPPCQSENLRSLRELIFIMVHFVNLGN